MVYLIYISQNNAKIWKSLDYVPLSANELWLTTPTFKLVIRTDFDQREWTTDVSNTINPLLLGHKPQGSKLTKAKLKDYYK